MAKASSFDPRTLVEDQQALTQTSDAMTANALKHQTFLHRQRLGAAQVRLARAMRNGAPPEQIAALEAKVLTREARLSQTEAQFATADIASPVANSDVAQVLGQVTGDAGEAPYTAALISANGELLASATVGDNRAFLLDQSGRISGARLQVSDATQTILFRDATGFDVDPGQIVTRTVALEDPGKPAAPAPTTLTTPNVVGQTEEAACAIFFRLGVREIDVSRQPSQGPAGLVLAQEPASGSVLVPANGAKLTVSATSNDPGPEPEPIQMPDLIDLTLDEAQATTRALGIRLASTQQPDAAPRGQVIAQSPPAGQVLSPPLQATAIVSAGSPETVRVPDVIEQSERQATATLQSAGFTVVRETVRQPGNQGLVVEQRPEGGTQVSPGSSVRIVVNLGERDDVVEVVVPRVTGRNADEAEVVARRTGFTVERVNVRQDGPAGIVVNQQPDAGARVTLPATLTITVNQGDDDRPTRPNDFTTDLTAAINQDQRLENIGLNRRTTGAMIQRLEVTDQRSLEAAIALDNAALMERAGLRNRTQARTLRSVLTQAMARMG